MYPYPLVNNSGANWLSSGLETLMLGGACATVAFTIGFFVNGLVGEDDSLHDTR
jgi:hypothetical protein